MPFYVKVLLLIGIFGTLFSGVFTVRYSIKEYSRLNWWEYPILFFSGMCVFLLYFLGVILIFGLMGMALNSIFFY